MSSLGKKIADFDDPVCDVFAAKILEDQLCYEFDPKAVTNETIQSFSFLMDYNEDRELSLGVNSSEKSTQLWDDKLNNHHFSQGASIYLDSLSKIIFHSKTTLQIIFYSKT